ncbi:hypothetical protein PGTUg99_024677 [Puccinia graminis f. sp. tritici]|uniref:Uncharacterized protein n=1 Tax=Puccinia graminis f. sp. tritici TaxID=56615 RepID=A0A5B0LUU7_PUCGR|nr:hypothetical protein PGTUg99_024677 [Puccinia graminis f. sp. tritici]
MVVRLTSVVKNSHPSEPREAIKGQFRLPSIKPLSRLNTRHQLQGLRFLKP